MAKIAVVFLLVALVAVCNGARFRREEPKTPEVGIDFQPVVNEIKNLFTEENLNKLKDQTNKLVKQAEENGGAALRTLAEWAKGLEDKLQIKKDGAPK